MRTVVYYIKNKLKVVLNLQNAIFYARIYFPNWEQINEIKQQWNQNGLKYFIALIAFVVTYLDHWHPLYCLYQC